MFIWNDLLLSTTSGFLLLRDKILYKLSVDEEGQPYSTSWCDEGVFFCCAKIIYLLRYDKTKVILDTNKTKDFHQISFFGNKLYAVHSNGNSLFKYNTEGCGKRVCGFGIHINSVFYYQKENKVYLCDHGGSKAGLAKILELDGYFKQTKVWNNIGDFNHCVYRTEDKIYTVNSGFGGLCEIDLETDKSKFVYSDEKIFGPNKDLWARGLAHNGKYFYIGVGQRAEREKRSDTISWILVLDNSLNYVDYYKIPIKAHIKDIRILNERDFAHSNDIKFNYDIFNNIKLKKID